MDEYWGLRTGRLAADLLCRVQTAVLRLGDTAVLLCNNKGGPTSPQSTVHTHAAAALRQLDSMGLTGCLCMIGSIVIVGPGLDYASVIVIVDLL